VTFAAAMLVILISNSIVGVTLAGTAEQYGALPTVRSVEISPDGKTLAILQSAGTATGIVFFDTATMKPTGTGANVGDSKARNIIWADNEHVLIKISKSETKRTTAKLEVIEFFRWLSVSKSSGKAKILFGNAGGYFISDAGEFLSTLPEKDGKALFQRINVRYGSAEITNFKNKNSDKFLLSLYEVNLKNGKEKRIATGTEYTQDWIIKENGEIAARIDYDPKKDERKIFTRNGKSFDEIVTFDEKSGGGRTANFWGVTDDGKNMYATTYTGDRRSLMEFSLTDGTFGKTIFSNPDFDIDGVIYEPQKAAATGLEYIDTMPRTFHLNPQDQKTQRSLGKALAGATPMIVSKSNDQKRLIVKALYSDHPTQYFMYDKVAKSLNMIAASYPELDGKIEANKEQYSYTSSDGLVIDGYLTVPKGSSKQNMPLIVLPHGGPEGRDDMSFDWWTFFYASRGYLVYQPNFRGSDGYGLSFRKAGFGEWGRRMQDDISNGVKKLIAEGIVDGSKICIVGASYGGYAALAGATLTPELYSCAVSVNGVTNLPRMLAEESDLGEEYWETRIGSRFRDANEMNAVSPVKIAGNAGMPILLIHGEDDTVVPYSHSVEMANALKAAGKQHEFVTLKDEDHWLSRSASRTQMLQRSIEFIDTHIGG